MKQLIVFALVFLSFSFAADCTCNSCTECSSDLVGGACTNVKVAVDLYPDQGVSCISAYGSGQRTLDCQGHSVNAGNSGTAISVDFADGLHISNCKAKGGFSGVSITNSPGISLLGVDASGTSYGLYASNSTNAAVSGGSFSGGEYAIILFNSGYSTVSSASADSATKSGVFVHYSPSVTLSGITATGSGNGVEISNSDSCTLSGISASGNDIGVLVGDSTSGHFSGLRLFSNADKGMQLTRAYDMTFDSLNASGNSRGGVYSIFSSRDTFNSPVVCGNGLFDIYDEMAESSWNDATCRNSSPDGLCAHACSAQQQGSNGSCISSCAAGKKTCSGNRVETCGDFNNDSCNEWNVTETCTKTGESCVNGSCTFVSASCSDECERGAAECSGSLISRCADSNGDGCAEWGQFMGCPTGQSCSNGRCTSGCSDECTMGDERCMGGLVQECVSANSGCNEWGEPKECANGTCAGGKCPSTQPAPPACKKEGETIPVIPNPPECCAGLSLIKPRQQNIIGISGICTSKCGNGKCDNETESEYNCPGDCQTRPECPQYMPPAPGWCANGTVVPQEADANGCPRPPNCEPRAPQGQEPGGETDPFTAFFGAIGRWFLCLLGSCG